MTKTLKELLGDELVQHNATNDQTSEISTSQLNGKTVVLYFSAHWCPPCRKFTPKLAQAYKNINDEVKNKLDIVFVSSDKNQDGFDEYFKDMPWKAMIYSDRVRSKQLSNDFNIEGIPSLIVLSPSLETITTNAIEEVYSAPEEALRKWSEGKSLFWTREPQEGEYVWEGTSCSDCFMNPLIGSRHGYTDKQQQQHVNLCETCFSKHHYEHPLIEYLIPKRQYRLEQILSSIPHLLDPNNDETIPTKTMWAEDIQSIGFYFSAHWCPPCRAFTPELAKFYKEIQDKSHSFNIIFVSFDREEESFNDYRSEMPWPAIPLDSNEVLMDYFRLSGIPTLIILSSDGKILSRQGCEDVEQHGAKALETWSRGEKLARPSPDDYKWLHVGCDECSINPIIGQRYSCPTCGNYDLCSTCQKKGHEHELELQSIPTHNDE